MHATYTRLEDLQQFRRTGQFSDGAVLVKTVRAAQGEDLTTGRASFASDVKVWFVLVKDSKNRFPTNPLWGDGWGWALFQGPDRTKQVATNYRTDCRTCHVPAKSTDWIYTRCYPLLQDHLTPGAVKTSSQTTTPDRDLVKRFPQWKESLTLQGNVKHGRQYFEQKTLNTAFTCASCHSFDARDTRVVDGDGLRRAGFPVYGAVHRTNIKQSGTGLAALGANVCVIHFMRSPEPGMTAQELADMDRFLHTGGQADHVTAANIDYPDLKWTIPEKLSGGDKKRGEALALRSCITCHAVGDKPARLVDASGPLEAGSYTDSDLKALAVRIRNPEFKHNKDMPGYSDLRLSNAELLDILAWLTTK